MAYSVKYGMSTWTGSGTIGKKLSNVRYLSSIKAAVKHGRDFKAIHKIRPIVQQSINLKH